MASEALGVDPDRIRIVNADTDSGPFSGNAGGSKITLTVGAAVVQAAQEAREQIMAIASDQLEVSADDLELAGNQVQVSGTPERSIGLDRIGALSTAQNGKYPPVSGQGRSGLTERAPGIAVHLARVRVDPDTHEPRVIDYLAIQDVGKAVNPAGIEDQIHGGVAQGIGWALYEGIVLDDEGRVLTGSLLDYAAPDLRQGPPDRDDPAGDPLQIRPLRRPRRRRAARHPRSCRHRQRHPRRCWRQVDRDPDDRREAPSRHHRRLATPGSPHLTASAATTRPTSSGKGSRVRAQCLVVWGPRCRVPGRRGVPHPERQRGDLTARGLPSLKAAAG